MWCCVGVHIAIHVDLESYCWMYSTWNIPREYKGACSGGDQVGYSDLTWGAEIGLIISGHGHHYHSL